jgi:hypothetical protein
MAAPQASNLRLVTEFDILFYRNNSVSGELMVSCGSMKTLEYGVLNGILLDISRCHSS